MKYLMLAVVFIAILVLTLFKRRGAPSIEDRRRIRLSPVAVGRVGSATFPTMAFWIKAAHVGHEVSERPPGHAPPPPGAPPGTWTVLDCVADSDPAARFLLALGPPTPTERAPVPLAAVKLWTPDRAAAKAVVAAFAERFQTVDPASRPPATLTLPPMAAEAAVLGQKLAVTEPGGPFVEAEDGDWVAMRVLVRTEQDAAAVFLNFNLAAQRGEFTEAEPGRARALVEALAEGLRDGPRPPRTPATDPSLAGRGAKVRDLRALPAGARVFFAPGGKLLLAEPRGDESSLGLTDLESIAAGTAPAEVLRAQGIIVEAMAGDAEVSVVVAVAEEAGRRRVVVARRGDRVTLDGPWGEAAPRLGGPAALSPDGRYLAVAHDVMRDDGSTSQALHFVDLATGRSMPAVLPLAASVVAWTGTASGALRAVLLPRPAEPSRLAAAVATTARPYVADPATGVASAARPMDDLPPAADPSLSPDGRVRLALEAGHALAFTDQATLTTRRFEFHEEDRRYATPGSVRWLSNEHVEFDGRRQAAIDLRTMKMVFPAPDDRPDLRFRFNPEFTIAAAETPEGTVVGRVDVGLDGA